MASAKTKVNGNANGTGPKTKKTTKVATPSPTASGTATPSIPAEDAKVSSAPGRFTKPDKTVYLAEQKKFQDEISALQEKMSALQVKIDSGSSSGSERRTQLYAEWDEIRQEQAGFKESRQQIKEKLRAKDEQISKLIKELQAAQAKSPFRTVEDIDARIKQLEQQVESGEMTIAGEKRALNEISNCRRTRRTVEGFKSIQDSINQERAAVDGLREKLNDPELKAVSERAEAVKAELDSIKKADDEINAHRSKLFSERRGLKEQLNGLYLQKRESGSKFKEDNDKYFQQVNEDRAKRAERMRAQRQAEDEARKKEKALQLREDAAIPAFQEKIEDCQTLIDYFSGKSTNGNIKLSTSSKQAEAKAELAGVPKLEIRQVNTDFGEGVVVKKKRDEEESYFVGGKGKAKGKKGGVKSTHRATNGSANGDAAPTAPTPSSSGTGALNMPYPTLAALLQLSIPPPVSSADLPRCVEDLKTKKAWFEANQARVTSENIAKAEAEIQRLFNGDAKPDSASAVDETPLEEEKPAEPTPTPAKPDGLSTGVSTENVDAILEDVKESQAEVEAETEAQ